MTRSLLITWLTLSASIFASGAYADTAKMSKEDQRAFKVCMQQILGRFADFKSTEVKLKAAELCLSRKEARDETPKDDPTPR